MNDKNPYDWDAVIEQLDKPGGRNYAPGDLEIMRAFGVEVDDKALPKMSEQDAITKTHADALKKFGAAALAAGNIFSPVITIITQWRGHPELLGPYKYAVTRDDVQLIIIDNGSNAETQKTLTGGGMFGQHESSQVIRFENNDQWFAPANNIGLQHAQAEIVLFLNNDVRDIDPGWLAQVINDVKDGALYGPELGFQQFGKFRAHRISGWCIAGTRKTWDDLGGWPEELGGGYYEDDLLCWIARTRGIEIVQTAWQLTHLRDYTSRHTKGAYDHSADNKRKVGDRILADVDADEGAMQIASVRTIDGQIIDAGRPGVSFLPADGRSA